MVLLFTCVLMLGCPAQENSNFRSCVSVERLFGKIIKVFPLLLSTVGFSAEREV